MCVEVVLINVLASHLAPPNKNSWLRPWLRVTALLNSACCEWHPQRNGCAFGNASFHASACM